MILGLKYHPRKANIMANALSRREFSVEACSQSGIRLSVSGIWMFTSNHLMKERYFQHVFKGIHVNLEDKDGPEG